MKFHVCHRLPSYLTTRTTTNAQREGSGCLVTHVAMYNVHGQIGKWYCHLLGSVDRVETGCRSVLPRVLSSRE